MAEKKTIEATVAQKGRKEGDGGKDAAAPPKEDEVGGRYKRGTTVICPHCGAVRFIVEETQYQQGYSCGNCGGDYHY
jgi:uncharacterized protein (DUF983 family)